MPFRHRDRSADAQNHAAILEAVAHLDTNPIDLSKQYTNMMRGCYAGQIVARNDRFTAVWSRRASRIVLIENVTTKGLVDVPIGALCAVIGWNGPAIVRPLSRDYDALDAWDDFAIEVRRCWSDWSTINGAPRSAMVLVPSGGVCREYRELADHYFRRVSARA